MARSWTIRQRREDDSFEDLTDLLHRAYAPLAARGLMYLATNQDVATTKRRAEAGMCFLAEDPDTGRLIGTITVFAPKAEHGRRSKAEDPAWYAMPGVAIFGQYGVDPAWKGMGLGRALHAVAEGHARTLGAHELACDTAEPATDLIAMYERWGYRVVDRADWDVTNFVSVVLSKTLVSPAASEAAG